MKTKPLNILLYVAAVLYALILLDIFFRLGSLLDGQRVATRSWNFIPFHSIAAYLSGSAGATRASAVRNILGNIAVFLPLGLFLQTFRRRKSFLSGLAYLSALSIGIELIQLAFGLGACDIDDVLLNTCGGMLGMLLYALLARLCKDEARTKRVVAILSLVIGAPVAIFYFTVFFGRIRL